MVVEVGPEIEQLVSPYRRRDETRVCTLSHGHLFLGVLAKIACDYATDFIKAELQVGLTFSILALQITQTRPRANTAHVGTTAQQPPQQDLLLALSFCRAVYGLTFRKGRSGMLRRNNEVKPLAAC